MMRVEQSIIFMIGEEIRVTNNDEMRELALAEFDKEFPGFRDRHGKALDIQQFEFDLEPIMQFSLRRPVAFVCRAFFKGLLR